jgi:tetratricopeptide (TPR) repeat protein
MQEREALSLLDFLFAKPLSKVDVVDHVQNSATISPAVRQKALALADRYQEETNPERYHQAARLTVRQCYLNPLHYQVALKQARNAFRLTPENPTYLTTLGLAQYRLGQSQDALTTLTRADKLNQGHPADVAFLALAQFKLGQKDQAQESLKRLRNLLKQDRWAKDEEAQAFLREAESLIEAK